MIAGKVDKSTLVGILVAAAGITVGLVLDGGKVAQVLQPTAALIVFGGTLGAVLVQFPTRVLLQAFRGLREVFFEPSPPSAEFIERLLGYALKARRRGLIALDPDLAKMDNLFLRKCLTCVVDGMRRNELCELMEADISQQEERDESLARVLDAAGGFAPTIGIIGAVLGLIQVMQRLDNIGEVGKGIAVAFVATLYGVGSANLVLLPLAGKVRIRAAEARRERVLILDAALSIAEGVSPRALKERLNSYLGESTVPAPREKKTPAAEAVSS